MLASGCGAVGRVTSGDPAHGKELFQDPKNQCASCHTLADAGSTGTIGPNLDDAFVAVKQQGFTLQSMRDLIRGQIAYPEKPMPANLLQGQDANDVATYIAQCAAVPSCGVTAEKPASTTTTGGGGGGTTTTAAAPDGKSIFTANCASCHTLKDAGTNGTVGPNLDQLKPSEARAEKQVRHGGGVMPAFQGTLSDAQIKAVATYVSRVAGK
ncbi:MAG TPA: c-type cytochrome [Gaiellaceae bacterium]|nr:c-type cytochrome [Gaiellaceae bacterium]